MSEWEKHIEDFREQWYNNEGEIIVQTSGSTGSPKSISLKKDHMRESARMTGEYLNLHAGDSALLALPIRYIAGKMMVVRAETLDLVLFSTEPTTRPEIIQSRFCALTPMQVRAILQDSPMELEQIDKLIIGGAPCGPDLERHISHLDIEAWETYGMTETITHIAMRRLGSPHFEALPGVRLSQDIRGCLIIDAPRIGVKELITNDLVKRIDATKFKWLGRADNVINSGGIKVSPEQIESQVSEILTEHNYIVSARKDAQLGERVVLLIEGDDLDDQMKSTMQEKIAGAVEKHHRPKEILSVPKFDRTPSGKVIRKNYLD